MSSASNYLIYDGSCPFCANFVRMSRLKDTVGSIDLINARDESLQLANARARGYVIDDGMLLYLDGEFYHGADCLNRLAILSTRSRLFNRVAMMLFRVPVIASLSYPILKAGRNLSLRVLGVRGLGY